MFREMNSVLAIVIAAAGTYVAAADWTQWRGPDRDGISKETGLLKSWPAEGPRVAWQVDHVGVGYSSIVVQGDRIVTQGDLDGVEHIIALSAEDGSVLWKVQPEVASARLAKRVADEMKRLDKNGDGKLDEIEARSGLGSNFVKADRRDEADKESVAGTRVEWLFGKLDVDKDGAISFAEAGRGLDR